MLGVAQFIHLIDLFVSLVSFLSLCDSLQVILTWRTQLEFTKLLVLLYDRSSIWLLLGVQPCPQIQAANAALQSTIVGT